MTFRIRMTGLLTVFLLIFPSCFLGALDQAPLTELEKRAKSIVEAAYIFILENSHDMEAVQEALMNDPRFIDREQSLYIFMHSYNASVTEVICRGQGVRPELLGRDMGALRTPTGRALFQEMAALVEEQGEGWIEYDWLHPFSNTIKSKKSYIKGIRLADGSNAWIGCGIWKE